MRKVENLRLTGNVLESNCSDYHQLSSSTVMMHMQAFVCIHWIIN